MTGMRQLATIVFACAALGFAACGGGGPGGEEEGPRITDPAAVPSTLQ